MQLEILPRITHIKPMDLFAGDRQRIEIAPGALLLGGFACAQDAKVLAAVEQISAVSPFRHLTTPGGYRMSVGMTCFGEVGWVSDRSGYRYEQHDPQTGKPWPAMPDALRELAVRAAAEAGYDHFNPNSGILNCYEPGTKLSLHQDKDEKDLRAPIVSLSFGLTATFQFGGLNRTDPTRKLSLLHGDAVVWGGPSRLAYHGILPLKPGHHPLFGERRINLTFRVV